MLEPKKINGLSEELYLSNLEEFETSSEEIDKIIESMEFVETFSFVDKMDILDN